MTHLTFREWIKFTNYNYDESDHITALENYEDFCFKNSFWAVID